MTIQEMDKIVISKTDNTYITKVRNDSIITPNIDNNISEVPEEHREDIIALFNKEKGEDALPPY